MPVPDPPPSPSVAIKRRFLRILRLLALLSIVIAGLAVILVSRGDPTLHVNMLIATALGAGFTVLLGTALMTLVFLSAESGHDEQASRGSHEENGRND